MFYKIKIPFQSFLPYCLFRKLPVKRAFPFAFRDASLVWRNKPTRRSPSRKKSRKGMPSNMKSKQLKTHVISSRLSPCTKRKWCETSLRREKSHFVFMKTKDPWWGVLVSSGENLHWKCYILNQAAENFEGEESRCSTQTVLLFNLFYAWINENGESVKEAYMYLTKKKKRSPILLYYYYYYYYYSDLWNRNKVSKFGCSFSSSCKNEPHF